MWEQDYSLALFYATNEIVESRPPHCVLMVCSSHDDKINEGSQLTTLNQHKN